MDKKIQLDTAAEELGVSTRTIRRLVSRGEPRGYRVRGTDVVRVDSDDVADLLEPITWSARG
jgi:excisionase family DNA binding protein